MFLWRVLNFMKCLPLCHRRSVFLFWETVQSYFAQDLEGSCLDFPSPVAARWQHLSESHSWTLGSCNTELCWFQMMGSYLGFLKCCGSKRMLPKLCYFCWWANAAAFLPPPRWRMKLTTEFRKCTIDTTGPILMQPVVLLTMYRGRWDSETRAGFPLLSVLKTRMLLLCCLCRYPSSTLTNLGNGWMDNKYLNLVNIIADREIIFNIISSLSICACIQICST